MKTSISKILTGGGGIFMLSALVITGCDALEGNSMKITIEESEKTVNFANEADAEQNVTFTATAAWTATVSEDWLEVSPMSGESGSNVITIRTLSTNPDEAQRTAEISLTAGGDPETITVTQEGTDTSNDDAREIRWENGNMTFLEGMCGTIVPSDTEAPETGFDLAFFLVSDNWLTPCSSYTGTFSKKLPASTDDGEGYTMKFEYESDNGVEYTFSYGEQTLPDYGIPEVTTK